MLRFSSAAAWVYGILPVLLLAAVIAVFFGPLPVAGGLWLACSCLVDDELLCFIFEV